MTTIQNGPNRAARRKAMKKEKFYGESKNFHLTVLPNCKYLRRKQYIRLADGSIKTIEHYDLQTWKGK